MFYTPVTGFTALHKAAQRGDEEDVAALLAEVRAGAKTGQHYSWGIAGQLYGSRSRLQQELDSWKAAAAVAESSSSSRELVSQ